MAGTVQVILKEDVPTLGKIGELVRVRPGYARNFLLPRGFATLATRANVKRIEHERQIAIARASKIRKSAEEFASTLSDIKICLIKQAGEEGKLFGSVTTLEIAQGLKALGHEVDKRKILLSEGPIRQTGTYEVPVKLAGGIVAKISVEVVSKT